MVVKIGREALLLVEAKYRSDVSERTTYDGQRDQVIRLIDVGSWHAQQERYELCYLIVLQYGAPNQRPNESWDFTQGNRRPSSDLCPTGLT